MIANGCEVCLLVPDGQVPRPFDGLHEAVRLDLLMLKDGVAHPVGQDLPHHGLRRWSSEMGSVFVEHVQQRVKGAGELRVVRTLRK